MTITYTVLRMGRTLYVAAGGGGDAIAAWALQRSCSDDAPVIATFSWDRLIIDPAPGPRCPSDFDGLRRIDSLNFAIQATTTVRRPAGSTLPRLTSELGATFVLLDPMGGAVGLAAQLRSLAESVGARAIEVIDVGGDILARGDEPELRSPLADSLVLASTVSQSVPVSVTVLGAGLDGELAKATVDRLVVALHAEDRASISLWAARLTLPVLNWFPSEASALLIAAVLGRRGVAEVRDHRRTVILQDESSKAVSVSASRSIEHNRIAAAMLDTESLDDAESIVRSIRGRSEIEYEREKARVRVDGSAVADLYASATDAIESASHRGVSWITYRRLAEQLHISTEQAAHLIQGLDLKRGSDNRPLVSAER